VNRDVAKSHSWTVDGGLSKCQARTRKPSVGSRDQGGSFTFVTFQTRLSALPPDARNELLLVLTSPSHVRADVIRQFHERGANDMVELLMMCEEDDFKRATMIEALKELS
jgi:hypothetical protein